MTEATYTNPVHESYMADPFILQHEGTYYAYGTANLTGDGRAFPVLQSVDLLHWEQVGGALTPIGEGSYWAPAVAYAEGTFYLYYSMGTGEGIGHKLRVATSLTPTGPFTDLGMELIPDQPFTIDAHPFQDEDGQWYLYYCQDFLELDEQFRVGTGIVVDRMVSMTQLAGTPQLVIRPFADWQIFQAQRHIYGNIVDWYTIEGAAPLYHNGRYYCFYSGGAWERSNYGISYVVADHPMGTYEIPTVSDAIVRTIPEKVIGPGHNTFTTTPDGQSLIVYHVWDNAKTARRMCIDRLEWADDLPKFVAPTFTPQPVFIREERVS